MSPFTPEQVNVIQQLRELWSQVDFFLVGASALGCYLDLRWRKTNDIDLSLAVSIEDYPCGLDKLTGWKQHAKKEHEWHGPGGIQVDVIPIGRNAFEMKEVTWSSGHRMSLIGMRLASRTAEDYLIEEGKLTVRVASLKAIALLKMVSFQDRPYERERDLEDLAYILDEYVDPYDDRLFGDQVPPDIELYRRPAFCLGFDLSTLLDPEEQLAVQRFIKLARGLDNDTTRSRLLRCGPHRWRERDDEDKELDALLDAFESGLYQTSSLVGLGS